MNREVCEHFVPVDLPCAKCKGPPTLREAAQQALEALEEYQAKGAPFWACDAAVAALRAALAEPEMERNFCPRCGKRSWPDTIHTCTPPQIGEQQ